MKVPELLSCSQEDQLHKLSAEGVFLLKRGHGNNAVLLYQLEDVYVEIHFLQYRMFIKELMYTKHTTILEPYLEQVDISELTKMQ
jgi:hypothetical protein